MESWLVQHSAVIFAREVPGMMLARGWEGLPVLCSLSWAFDIGHCWEQHAGLDRFHSIILVGRDLGGHLIEPPAESKVGYEAELDYSHIFVQSVLENSQNRDCTSGGVLDGLAGSPITVYAEAEQDGSALLPAGFTQGFIQFLGVQTQEHHYIR